MDGKHHGHTHLQAQWLARVICMTQMASETFAEIQRNRDTNAARLAPRQERILGPGQARCLSAICHRGLLLSGMLGATTTTARAVVGGKFGMRSRNISRTNSLPPTPGGPTLTRVDCAVQLAGDARHDELDVDGGV
ncbi:hypothetical protein CDEST_01801 [Colletotrichum destructivum]|uniref:Uncharacterized protein n=1 Tax=Colletotrichum destructivum TaxID=34406 RepID=A0AAX4I105_9PEZI|nr:hypothetical protein CDEST_01801 [Colletotrichum destructivum]